MRARLVQLSDLHLTASEPRRTRGVDVWGTLRRALRAATELAPDRLILTGDLANLGERESYRGLRELLAPWADRVRILPGNHDHRGHLSAELGALGFSEPLGAWRLIGLDSKRSRRVHGQLGAEELARLERELGDGDGPVMLFLHHPPVKVGTWWLDKDLLRDARQLERLLAAKARVRAIFCGHVHQELRARFAGSEVFTTPSTAYAFRPRSWVPARLGAEGPGLRVVELEGEAFTTRVVRLADHAPRDASGDDRGPPAR